MYIYIQTKVEISLHSRISCLTLRCSAIINCTGFITANPQDVDIHRSPIFNYACFEVLTGVYTNPIIWQSG